MSSLSSVRWTHAQIAPLCACPNLSDTVNMADDDAQPGLTAHAAGAARVERV